MKRLIQQQGFLFVVSAVLLLVGLGPAGLFDDDEAATAATSATMVRTGNWLVPRLNDELEVRSPIGVYWLQAASMRLFGRSEIAVRSPSALLGLATVIMIYHLGRKLYSQDVGLLAGLILTSLLLFLAYARAATAEMSTVFCQTMAVGSYVWIVSKQRGGNFNGLGISASATPEPIAADATDLAVTTPVLPEALKTLVPPDRRMTTLIFLAIAVAGLTSGLVAMLIPMLSIIVFLLITLRNVRLQEGTSPQPVGPLWRQRMIAVRQLLQPTSLLAVARSLRLAEGLAIIAAVVLPWYLAVGWLTNGRWLDAFFWEPQVRWFSSIGAQTLWIFASLAIDAIWILLLWLPWSPFLGSAIIQWRDELDDPQSFWRHSDRLLGSWMAVWLVSLVFQRHFSEAIVPICPVVALLLGRYLHDWQRDDSDASVYPFIISCRALAVAGIALMLGFTVAAYLYFPSEQWVGLIGVLPLLGAVLALRWLDRGERQRAVQTLLIAAVSMSFLTLAIAPPRIAAFLESPQFVADARRFAGTDTIELATFDLFKPSLVFYAGQNIPRLKTPREVADFLARGPHAFVIAKASQDNELRDELRGDMGEVSRHRSFLGREQLMLLGRR